MEQTTLPRVEGKKRHVNLSYPVPFKTSDAILAICLYMAGVPEWIPPTNEYDELILKRLGYGGLKLIEAARKAAARKDRGRVEYWYEKTKELDYFLKCYSDQEAEISAKGDDIDAGERIRQIMAKATRPEEERSDIPGPIMDEREALIRIFCIVLKFRVPFVNRWKEAVPAIVVSEKGSPKVINEDTTRYPGMKRVPVNASDEMLRKLKLL
jgi:hypothetical protein